MEANDDYYANRYRSRIAVFLVMTRETNNGTEILLQRRCNTGYKDGMYDMAASGHVEKGETLSQSVVREAKEELGIEVDEYDLEFLCLIHPYKDDYLNVFYKAKKYIGTPTIMEKDKCDDLSWFNIDNLPDNLIPRYRNTILCIKNNILYDDDDFTFLNRVNNND